MTLSLYRTNGAFTRQSLNDTYDLWIGQLPEELRWSDEQFQQGWGLHPDDYHTIWMPRGPVKTPRWQQAYENDYHFTGRTNKALPTPAILQPFLDWSREHICDALNGTLVNWYDGQLRHYIGKHRDSTKNLVHDAPIVTISFGERRIFRLRPWKGTTGTQHDFPATDGAVFVMPYETNLAWTHEVPKSARHTGRRISVTLRAFDSPASK